MSTADAIAAPDTSRRILKRVGIVLTVLGAVDIGAMVYCLINKVPYGSSLNVFACVAGVMLMNGSLRAARIVRASSAFMLGSSAAVLTVMPFVLPINLALLLVHLAPLRVAVLALGTGGIVAVLAWACRELSRALVLSVSIVRPLPVAVPALAGFFLACTLAGLAQASLSGADSKRAVQEATTRTGPGFNYVVTSLKTSSALHVRRCSADVLAYDTHQVTQLSVEWSD